MRHPSARHAAGGFTLLEVMTVLLILAPIINMVYVCYVRTERANDLGLLGLERSVGADKVLLHLRRTVRTARAVLDRHGPWQSDRGTLVLRKADGTVAVFLQHNGRLAEIDGDHREAPPVLHPVYTREVRFDYGASTPAKARAVTVALTLDPVWHDTQDRLVVRTTAALRRDREVQP